jgi:uncharacterized protein YegL
MGRRTTKGHARMHVIVVQDRSGSMAHRREATISGFNEYIDGLRKEDADIRVTLTQFDHNVENRYTAKPLHQLNSMRRSDYRIGGGTALYDAVGTTILNVKHAIGSDDKVLVVIMTDGEENSSSRWTRDTVMDLMDDKRDAGWEFIFMGAGDQSWSGGQALGFDYSHSLYYTNDSHDHAIAYNAVTDTTLGVLRGATAGQSLSMSQSKISLENKSGITPDHTHTINTTVNTTNLPLWVPGAPVEDDEA